MVGDWRSLGEVGKLVAGSDVVSLLIRLPLLLCMVWNIWVYDLTGC